MVAQKRLTESRVTMESLLTTPGTFSNLPAFLDLKGSSFVNMDIFSKITLFRRIPNIMVINDVSII